MEFQPNGENFSSPMNLVFTSCGRQKELESTEEKEKYVFLSASSRKTVTEVGLLVFTFGEVLHTKVNQTFI